MVRSPLPSTASALRYCFSLGLAIGVSWPAVSLQHPWSRAAFPSSISLGSSGLEALAFSVSFCVCAVLPGREPALGKVVGLVSTLISGLEVKGACFFFSLDSFFAIYLLLFFRNLQLNYTDY